MHGSVSVLVVAVHTRDADDANICIVIFGTF